MATRREMREAVFMLLFETGFRLEESPADILDAAREEREAAQESYVENTYLGTVEKMAVLDVLITRFSNGWKTTRMSHVSRAVLRLCTYEMLYTDVPVQIALNEAIELAKKYDDPKARPFVNGVLNSIKNEIVATGKEQCVAQCEQAVADAAQIPEAEAADVAEAVEAAADEEQ